MAVYDLLIDKVQDSNEGELSVNQLNVWDSTFRVQDTDDTTKELAFDVGSLTTATTRTITIPDRSFTLGGGDGSRYNIVDTGGAFATPVVLTAAQSGRVILVDDAAGLDFTLPALAAADVGIYYKFLVTTTITSNSFRVTAQAGDLLRGGLWMVDFDAAYTAPQGAFIEPDESDDLVMTMNGSTTGGKKGTVVELIGVTATGWFVTGTVAADGVIATPFS